MTYGKKTPWPCSARPTFGSCFMVLGQTSGQGPPDGHCSTPMTQLGPKVRFKIPNKGYDRVIDQE